MYLLGAHCQGLLSTVELSLDVADGMEEQPSIRR